MAYTSALNFEVYFPRLSEIFVSGGSQNIPDPPKVSVLESSVCQIVCSMLKGVVPSAHDDLSYYMAVMSPFL